MNLAVLVVAADAKWTVEKDASAPSPPNVLKQSGQATYPNNYYVARANALEDNVTIYDTVNGRRTERKRTSMKVASNQWHTLRVDFQGNHFTVTCDGRKAIEWDDNTFKDAGNVGVWTKADSVTSFDDFSYGAK